MASLMDEFFPPKPDAAPVQQVLPPDAPKSNPPPPPAEIVESAKAVAAAMEASRLRKDGQPGLMIDDSKNPTGDAVAPKVEEKPAPAPEVSTPAREQTPATAEAPKRKRGRPAGSANKPPETPPEVTEKVVVSVDRISIHHSIKLGKPNYSSAGVDVGMEGTVPPGGSLADAKAALSLQVRELLMSELKVYDKRPPAEAVNADGGK